VREIKISLNPEVVFNSKPIDKIVIKWGAQKHFKKESADIFLYIASTLNGQNRTPDEPSNDPKKEVYKVASCVAMDNVPKIAGHDYRDTYFHVDQERATFIFFHGSQRDERQYEKIAEKQKERME
jgi:hypothetical protein